MYGVTYDNPWLLGVDHARRPVPVWIAVLGSLACAAAILAAARVGGGAAVEAVRGALALLGGGWPLALAVGVVQLAVFAGLLAIAVIGLSVQGRVVGGRGGPRLAWGAAGLALGAAGLVASAAIAGAAGRLAPSGLSPLQPIAAGAALGLALILAQSFSEEMLFRAWLQPLLGVRLGPWLGLGATSVIFGAFHAIAGAAGPLALVNMCLGGLVFGLLALRSGGLTAAATAHFAWNWTESGGLGLEPSPTGGLVNVRLDGPALWSGGAERMNGSLATTLVLLTVAAALVLVGALKRPRD